jgi:hypothetical protein
LIAPNEIDFRVQSSDRERIFPAAVSFSVAPASRSNKSLHGRRRVEHPFFDRHSIAAPISIRTG